MISPYREQVYRQQRVFLFKDSIVDAATENGYQGHERDLIVLSTVRANVTGQVWFLSDLRRLNVAITRARFGTVEVG